MSLERRSQREIWLGGILAIVIGLTASALQRVPAMLAAQPDCPGLFEATAAFTFRLIPTAAAGIWILRANAVLLPLGVGVTTVLLRLASESWLVAAAVGLAIGAQPVLAPVISPLDPALLLVGAATGIALTDRWAMSSSRAVVLGLLVTALIAPRAGVPLAAMAGACLFSRGRLQAAIAATIVLGGSLAMPSAALALPPQFGATSPVSCTPLPLPLAETAHVWLNGAHLALASMGPYAVGLAVLGGFVVASSRRSDLWVLAYVLMASTGTASFNGSFLRGFGTLLIGMWMCVAVGLREVLRGCTSSVAGRVAAITLVVLLPAFQILRRPATTRASETHGLEHLSTRNLKHILALLPDRSVLVQEDASVAVLLRAISGDWEKMRKTFGLVSRDPDAVHRIETGEPMRVFALPFSQSELQWLGVAMTDAHLADVSGVAEARSRGLCQQVRSRWLEVPSVPEAHATVLSLISNHAGEEYGTILYIASDAEAHPSTVNWPANAIDGFEQRTYAEGTDADLTRLASDMREDDVSAELARRFKPFVMRLKLWRTSGGPAILPVDLGRSPNLVVARGVSMAEDKVCPAFVYGVQDLRVGY